MKVGNAKSFWIFILFLIVLSCRTLTKTEMENGAKNGKAYLVTNLTLLDEPSIAVKRFWWQYQIIVNSRKKKRDGVWGLIMFDALNTTNCIIELPLGRHILDYKISAREINFGGEHSLEIDLNPGDIIFFKLNPLKEKEKLYFVDSAGPYPIPIISFKWMTGIEIKEIARINLLKSDFLSQDISTENCKYIQNTFK